MFLRTCFLISPFLGFMVLSTSFQSTKDNTLELLANPSVPALSSNASLNTPRFHVECDGETYGYNPNIRDCEQAKEDWAPDAKVWKLGERRTGLPPDTVPLPYRVMGPRGLCYIQPTLIGNHRTGEASITMIRRAAAGIILQCIATAGSQGGIATGIGGDNNVAVSMGGYQKPVMCGARLNFWEQCREIVFSMPADKGPQVFGPRGDPTVTRGLPIRISSLDSKCTATLFSAGRTDVASFYDIWQGVTAMFSVCVRRGLSGSVRGIGQDGNIFLTMTTRETIELPSNSSRGASS